MFLKWLLLKMFGLSLKTCVIVMLVVVLQSVRGRKLPEYIRPCSRSHPKLNECSLRVAKAVSSTFAKGDTERGIPRLEPLEFGTINTFGSGRSNELNVKMRDNVMTGVGDLEVKKINIDLKTKRFSVRLFGNLKLESTYDISGRLLVIPLDGRGHAVTKLRNNKIEYIMNYDLITGKDGLLHGNITNDEIKYDIGKAIFKFDNLFNGDVLLGNTTQALLNELWRDVIEEFAPPVNNVLKQSVTRSIQAFLDVVPYDEIFLP